MHLLIYFYENMQISDIRVWTEKRQELSSCYPQSSAKNSTKLVLDLAPRDRKGSRENPEDLLWTEGKIQHQPSIFVARDYGQQRVCLPTFVYLVVKCAHCRILFSTLSLLYSVLYVVHLELVYFSASALHVSHLLMTTPAFVSHGLMTRRPYTTLKEISAHFLYGFMNRISLTDSTWVCQETKF